jgi:ABC-2 type transport system permease protein
MPAALVTFIVGVASFAALGMAVAALVPNASSASAVANATILPLAFVSNVFIVAGDGAPGWMTAVGDFFPLKPFVEGIQDTLNPFVEAPGFDWSSIGYVALWGVVGLLLAVKYFRWEPRPGATPRRRRSSRGAEDGAS